MLAPKNKQLRTVPAHVTQDLFVASLMSALARTLDWLSELTGRGETRDIFYGTLRVYEEKCRTGHFGIPIALILGFGLVLFCCSQFPIERKEARNELGDPLQALLTVIAPTRSLWPPSYSALVNDARIARRKVIKIPLYQLLSDVSTGRMELRDPQLDLCDLFQDTLCVYGWGIRLSIGYCEWMTAARSVSTSILSALLVCDGIFSNGRMPLPDRFTGSPQAILVRSRTVFASYRRVTHDQCNPLCHPVTIRKGH